MAPASLDLAWRTTAGTEVSNRVDDRPPGWARLDLGSPPDLGAGIAAPPDARALNADLPVETTPSRPAAPFRFAAAGAERDRALFCLTEAIYYEAALEPEAGQAAVAQVILNRARHPAFPHSICAVVYQGAGGVTGCQFTYVCDGARSRRPVAALWKRARLVAERAAGGYVEPGVGAATAYHADYVFPRWAPTLVKVAQIGRHIFYRFPGPWGQPDILRQPYAGGDLRVALAAPAPPAIVVEGDRPVVGVASFADHKIESGRRAPSPDEIARINAALLEMDRRLPAPPPSS